VTYRKKPKATCSSAEAQIHPASQPAAQPDLMPAAQIAEKLAIHAFQNDKPKNK
jgi:hypothetical protein